MAYDAYSSSAFNTEVAPVRRACTYPKGPSYSCTRYVCSKSLNVSSAELLLKFKNHSIALSAAHPGIAMEDASEASDTRKHYHKTCTHIYQLPPENLAEIFRLNTLPDVDISIRLGTLFKYTQVFRYWRGVAFEHASLWSRMESGKGWTSWIQFLLERSKFTPLSISLDADRSVTPRYLHGITAGALTENAFFVLRHMHRGKSLYVVGHSKPLELLFPFI